MRTVPSLRALIQDRNHSVECTKLPPLFIEEDFDLDAFRKALIESPIGADDIDIFFPSWTTSVYMIHDEEIDHCKMTWAQIENAKTHIHSPDQLKVLFEFEEKTPGSTSIIFQKCRSKRYSRKTACTVAPTNVERQFQTGGQKHGRSRRHFHRTYGISSHPCDTTGYFGPSFYPLNNSFGMNTFHQPCVGLPIPTYIGPQHSPAPPLITPPVFQNHGNPVFNEFTGQLIPYCNMPIRPANPVIQQGYQVPWNMRSVEFITPTWFLN